MPHLQILTRAAWRANLATALLASFALAGCGPPASSSPDPTPLVPDGRAHGALTHPARGHWSALIFVATECPISNHYAPEIRRICAEYAASGVQCTLVYPDAHAADAVRAHGADFRLDLPAVIDHGRRLVKQAGATVTPQAAVFTADGTLAYSGRIDDLYAALGRPRQRATERDLRNALDDLVAGRPVRRPRTQAIGCYIE